MPRPNRFRPKQPKHRQSAIKHTAIDVELHIDDLSHDGRGIGRVAGKAVFIDEALPDEVVKARITQQKSRYDEGHMLEVIHASPHRVKTKCEYHGICGGCVLQHLEAAEQIHYKQQQLLNNLSRIARAAVINVLAPIQESSWNYRRRARISTSYDKKAKKLRIGFRQKQSTAIVPITHCETLVSPFSNYIHELELLLNTLEKPQAISHLELAQADNANALVLRQIKTLSDADCSKLKTYAESKQLQVYLLGKEKGVITPLGDNYKPLKTVYAALDITYVFTPTDFIQVNKAVNTKIIDQALDLLDANMEDMVLDLFCGMGNFSLPLSRLVNKVVGVEGSAQLIKQARHNAEINHCNNINFVMADLNQDIQQQNWLRNNPFNKVILDPPRNGAIELMPILGKLGCEKIIYISCNPATLARDAAALCENFKYKIQHAGVMDMFPHTSHVESMVVFEKK